MHKCLAAFQTVSALSISTCMLSWCTNVLVCCWVYKHYYLLTVVVQTLAHARLLCQTIAHQQNTQWHYMAGVLTNNLKSFFEMQQISIAELCGTKYGPAIEGRMEGVCDERDSVVCVAVGQRLQLITLFPTVFVLQYIVASSCSSHWLEISKQNSCCVFVMGYPIHHCSVNGA